MTETAAGEIYVGAGFGLYRFHPEAETSDRRFEPIALPGSPREIECVFEDSQHRLWASGMDRGYIRDSNGKWRALTEIKPLVRSHQAKVQQPVEDPAGDVWLATFSRLRCFRKTGELETYSRTDHPRLGEYALTAVVGPDGKIYVGFDGGGIARL